MTLFTHSGSLPAHQYVWIEPDAIGKHDWLFGVWFGLTCWPGRATDYTQGRSDGAEVCAAAIRERGG